MGIYYAVVDHKSKRILWLGKAYSFVRFFDDHAPFTMADRAILCGKDYTGNDYTYSEGYYEAIVDFCTEADWDATIMADDYSPSYHDLGDEYEKFQIDKHHNIVPWWLAEQESMKDWEARQK